MSYGNLPGGGYSGFLKAEKPLLIKKRNYIPVKDAWPPKYGVYGQELPESEVLLPKDEVYPSKRETKKLKSRKVRFLISISYVCSYEFVKHIFKCLNFT